MRLSIPYRFVIGIFWIGTCHSQDGCATCRSRRRRLTDFSKASGKTITVGQQDEIKTIMERAGHQVETVTQFSNLNSLLSERDVGLKAVSGAVDSISLSLLGFIRDLLGTLEAIPIVGAGASAVIGVLEAVDDVFYDVLDVVLVFLRDDLVGALVGADASVSSDARSTGLVNGDGFLDFFPPVETFVEGVEEAIGLLEDVISDPAAAQQAVLNATGLSLERITPIVGPLAVLESIVSDTLTDISCVLDGEGEDPTCRAANSTHRCNIDRLVCSAQNFFGGKRNQTESGVSTNTTDVILNESNTTAEGVDIVTVGINNTEFIDDRNVTESPAVQTNTTSNVTEP